MIIVVGKNIKTEFFKRLKQFEKVKRQVIASGGAAEPSSSPETGGAASLSTVQKQKSAFLPKIANGKNVVNNPSVIINNAKLKVTLKKASNGHIANEAVVKCFSFLSSTFTARHSSHLT